jgi:hypothetical protein
VPPFVTLHRIKYTWPNKAVLAKSEREQLIKKLHQTNLTLNSEAGSMSATMLSNYIFPMAEGEGELYLAVLLMATVHPKYLRNVCPLQFPNK